MECVFVSIGSGLYDSRVRTEVPSEVEGTCVGSRATIKEYVHTF